MFIIKNMSFSKSLGNKQKGASIEFRVAQDADRLDALGAIGIARVFAYGGSKSRPLYDPTKRPQSFKTSRSYKVLRSTSLHHFDEKLFLLKELMNTASARKIAASRHRYMKAYQKKFLAEWHGKQ